MQSSILKISEALKSSISNNSNQWNAIKLQAEYANPWFTQREIDRRINSIVENYLNEEQIKYWLSSYNLSNDTLRPSVSIVAAGNIPLVSFPDILCAIAAMCPVYIKLSSKDEVLTQAVIMQINENLPEHYPHIQIVDKLPKSEKYIITGSNLSKEHFLPYLKSAPSIFRGHKSSIGLLTGNETEYELIQLGKDVFSYFGMGCRNITKLYLPKDYDFNFLMSIWNQNYDYLKHHSKYFSNLEFQRSILMLNRIEHVYGENILLIPNKSLSPPISCLYYTEYNTMDELVEMIGEIKTGIQAISGIADFPLEGLIEPGQLQQPKLITYQDNIDTLEFLLN